MPAANSHGRAFNDYAALRDMLAADEPGLARAFAQHLIVYGTARRELLLIVAKSKRILDRSKAANYGVRTLLLEVISARSLPLLTSPAPPPRTAARRRAAPSHAGAALSTGPRRASVMPQHRNARRFVGMMTNMGILPELFFPMQAGRDLTKPRRIYIQGASRAHDRPLRVSLPGVDGGHEAEKCFLTGAPGASRGLFRTASRWTRSWRRKPAAPRAFHRCQ